MSDKKQLPDYTIIDGNVYEKVADMKEADLVFSKDGYWKKLGKVKELIEEPYTGPSDKQLLNE